jgi:hypothetical protein
MPVLPQGQLETTEGGGWRYEAFPALYALLQGTFVPILGGHSDRFGREPLLLVSLGGSVRRQPVHGFGRHAGTSIHRSCDRGCHWRQHGWSRPLCRRCPAERAPRPPVRPTLCGLRPWIHRRTRARRASRHHLSARAFVTSAGLVQHALPRRLTVGGCFRCAASPLQNGHDQCEPDT